MRVSLTMAMNNWRLPSFLILLCVVSPAWAAWPNLLIGFQDATPSDPKGTAWFISGSVLGVSQGMTVQDMLEMPDDHIRSRLQRYLESHQRLGTGAGLLVVLDMEHPVSMQSFASLIDPERHDELRRLVESFKRRIMIVRTMLPDAVIGLYGVGTPPARGRMTSGYAKQIQGLVAAAKMGLLEHVQAVCPAVYSRFGPEDAAYGALSLSGIQAVSACRQIVAASERDIPIVPLLSFTVFNGHSKNNHEPVDLETLARCLTRLAEIGISGVAFWNAGPMLIGTDISISNSWKALMKLKPKFDLATPKQT